MKTRNVRDIDGKAVKGTKVVVTTYYDSLGRPTHVTTIYPHGLLDECPVRTHQEATERVTLIYKIASLTQDEDVIAMVATGAISTRAAREILRGLATMRGVEQKRFGTG